MTVIENFHIIKLSNQEERERNTGYDMNRRWKHWLVCVMQCASVIVMLGGRGCSIFLGDAKHTDNVTTQSAKELFHYLKTVEDQESV